jgi:hypothetical protein
LAARIVPPLAPLIFPRATRARSFAGLSPLRIASTMSAVAFARRFESAGILRCFMSQLSGRYLGIVNGRPIQTETQPADGRFRLLLIRAVWGTICPQLKSFLSRVAEGPAR